MKKTKKESLVLGKLFQKLAPRIGASVFLEPEWGIAGQITFASGKRSYFRYNTVDLNPVGASDIVKDKAWATLFMARMGYPVVPGSKTFYSKEWSAAIGARGRGIDDAYRYAKKIGLPVIVKPNSGSQGSGVAFATTRREFYRAVRAIFKRDRVALVQKPVYGRDYRIVVLDAKVISAYERIPLSVVGDGKRTIAQLLRAKEAEFVAHSRGSKIKKDDPRMLEKLAREGRTVRFVPARGEAVALLDNANLSTGGDAIDVTGAVHSRFLELAIALTKDMGLRLCGVDMMIQGDITKGAGTCWILEINAAPGLDHYAKSGKKQEAIVEKLYLEVLKSLERDRS